jgi:hypothetical protein
MLNLEYKNTKGIVTGYHQYKSPFQLIQMVYNFIVLEIWQSPL